MTIRTSTKTVTFKKSFNIAGLGMDLPAGAYKVDTDEELLEGISFPAYRRKATLLHLHPRPGHPGLSQTITVDPLELDAALKRDRAATENSVGPDSNQGADDCAAASQWDAADEKATQRGENEGMAGP